MARVIRKDYRKIKAINHNDRCETRAQVALDLIDGVLTAEERATGDVLRVLNDLFNERQRTLIEDYIEGKESTLMTRPVNPERVKKYQELLFENAGIETTAVMDTNKKYRRLVVTKPENLADYYERIASLFRKVDEEITPHLTSEQKQALPADHFIGSQKFYSIDDLLRRATSIRQRVMQSTSDSHPL